MFVALLIELKQRDMTNNDLLYKSVAIATRSTFWTSKEDNSDELIIDAEDLAKEIQQQCVNLAEAGYDVISIVPINSGNISNGKGYTHTSGVIITGKK